MLMAGALTPKSRAIVGSAVARTVASSCSMNIALAMMSAIVRNPGCGRGEAGTEALCVAEDMGGTAGLATPCEAQILTEGIRGKPLICPIGL